MLALTIAAALMTVAVGCGRPPLRIVQQGQSIIIDMQTLGEYPSDVARVRIIDAARNDVVWEVVGRNDPQVGRIQLKVGANPVQISDVRHGAYEVVAPAGKNTFTLAPGVRYAVEAWRSASNPRTKRTAEFVAPQP